MRLWPERRAQRPRRLDLELEVADRRFVRLDHFCAGADMHRLLGVELTAGERELLQAGEAVAVVVACDRCIWERRLVLRLGTALSPSPGSVEDEVSDRDRSLAGSRRQEAQPPGLFRDCSRVRFAPGQHIPWLVPVIPEVPHLFANREVPEGRVRKV